MQICNTALCRQSATWRCSKPTGGNLIIKQRPLFAPHGASGHTLPLKRSAQRTTRLSSMLTSATASTAVKGNATQATKFVRLLHQAAEDRSIAPSELTAAMTELEKQKLPVEGLEQTVGGDASPGRRWQLLYTAGGKEVQKALKGQVARGQYFPLVSVERWDAQKHETDRGVYLGHIASMIFTGSWKMIAKKMTLDFNRVNVKLGPWKFGFNLKPEAFLKKNKDGTPITSSAPFFLFAYADDQVVVARGQTGGMAIWARTTPSWEAEAGVTQA